MECAMHVDFLSAQVYGHEVEAWNLEGRCQILTVFAKHEAGRQAAADSYFHGHEAKQFV